MLVALVGLTTAPAPAREKPVFPSSAHIVTIDAVVVGRDGRPVQGLSAADFEIEEDGALQAVTHFEAVSVAGGAAVPGPSAAPAAGVTSNEAPVIAAPRSFVLVYDDVHVDPSRGAAARDAVASFLRGEVRPGERVALVATGSGAWWTAEVPEGRDDLLAFLEAQSGRSSRAGEELTDVEAQRIGEHDDAGVREWVVDRWIRQGRCQDLCEFVRPCDPREGRRACADLVQAEALRRHAEARGRLGRTLATMSRAMAGLAGERGRKSLVLVSEGFVFDPSLPAYREIVQASLRANAAIHFLDLRGLAATSPVADASQRGDFPDAARVTSEESALAAAGAEQVAEESGGFAIRGGNDLAAGLARVGREAEVYYLLGYTPPARAGRAGFRRVKVRVAREGVTVRARRGYFVDAAGRVEEPRRPAAAEPRPDGPKAPPGGAGAYREALSLSLVPRQDLRLQATAYVGPPADRGRAKVRLVAELDRSSLGAPGEAKGGARLEVRGDVWPRRGREWVGLDRAVKVDASPVGEGPAWHALTWDIALPPGVYQARLRLREAASGREGSLTHRFEVGDLRSFRFATPIVADALQRDGGGAPRLAAGASRAFAAGTGRSLYVQLELLGAKGGVAARVLLRDAAGRERRAVPWGPVPADPGGRLVRAIGFALDDLEPGRYRLRLEARDEKAGDTVAHEEPVVLR